MRIHIFIMRLDLQDCEACFLAFGKVGAVRNDEGLDGGYPFVRYFYGF